MERRNSLTLDNTDAAVDAQDETQDSPVMKALRSQVRDLKKQLKATPDRETLADELRSELARDNSIISKLEGYGYPEGILDTVKAKLGEGEVTDETVTNALTSIGFKIADSDAVSDDAGSESTAGSELVDVTSLSGQVATAASNVAPDTVMDEINSADTPEEVAAAMEKAGLAVSHI